MALPKCPRSTAPRARALRQDYVDRSNALETDTLNWSKSQDRRLLNMVRNFRPLRAGSRLAEIHQFPDRPVVETLHTSAPLELLDRYLARKAVIGAVKADQAGDHPFQKRHAVGEDGLQNGLLALECHDIMCIGIVIGVACDIRPRLAGLAVGRDPIRFKGYFGVIVSDDLAVLGQHVDNLRFMAVGGGGCDVGCDDRVATDAGTRPVPVVHERLHGDVAPIMIVISAAGGAIFLFANAVADVCQSVGYRGKPSKELFSPFGTEIEMTGPGTPGGHVSCQFDVDRNLLDGCRDVIAIEIANEAVRADPGVASRLRCVEQLRLRVEKLHKTAAVGQREIEGDPWRERTVRADIGLRKEDHDNGRTVVEMSIEVPPSAVDRFGPVVFPLVGLGYVTLGDAKSLIIGGTIRHPEMTVLAAMHGSGFSWHGSIVWPQN